MKTRTRKIIDVLRTSKHWLKRQLASRKLAMSSGNTRWAVDPEDPRAKSFCLLGAAIRCHGRGTAMDLALRAIYDAMPARYRALDIGMELAVVTFNNAPETNFYGIRRVLQRANI